MRAGLLASAKRKTTDMREMGWKLARGMPDSRGLSIGNKMEVKEKSEEMG